MISVIIPVYNKVRVLDECLEAVVNQDYKDLEILLVNDGSTDNSGEICEKWAKKDSRIVYVAKENTGISDTKNSAIKIAKGEYIAFCDADDVPDKSMYGKLLRIMEKENSDIVFCGNNRIEDGKIICQKYSVESQPMSREGIYQHMYMGDRELFLPIVVSWTKLFKKKIFDNKDCMFSTGKIYEDNYVIHHYVEAADSIYWLNENLYNWRIESGSITHSGLKASRMDDVRAQMDRLYFLKDKYGDRPFFQKMIRQCLDNGMQFYCALLREKIATRAEMKEYLLIEKKLVKEFGPLYKENSGRKLLWRLFTVMPYLLIPITQVKNRKEIYEQ